MICAIGLGILGVLALRRARRHACHGGGWSGGGCGGGWAAWRRHTHRGHDRRRWMFHAALQRIDATPAQERLVVAELDKLAERLHVAKATVQDSRGELATAVRGSSLDDAALGSVLGRVDSATAEARAATTDALRAIHAALDDKQRAALADMIDRRGSGGRGGWWRTGPYR